MFWIFRKRKPLHSASFYLNCAAGILQARGKCEGRTYDDWGRVDAIGAMRIAVWGTTDWDRVKQSRKAELWKKYQEVKESLHKYVAEHEKFSGLPKSDPCMPTYLLMAWSDQATPHAVINTMRKAAKAAKTP